MPGPLNRSLLSTLLGLLTLTTLFYYFSSSTPVSAAGMPPSSPRNAAAATAPGQVSSLAVSLHQKPGTSPATLTARITNTNPTTTFTLLTWDTPLDPLALQLGLATLTLAGGTGETLDLPVIQVRRKLPPAPESFVTLAPGESRERDFALEEPRVPVEKIRAESGDGGGRVKVVLRGTWSAGVWAVREGEPVGRMGAEEERLTGEWESGEVEVVV